MKKRIKLYFVDFWDGFDIHNNYFLDLLSRNNYDVELTGKPDFLIYSVFGTEHSRYDCVKIFYTGENFRPNFNECDFAFTFDYIDNPRHYRLPLYALTIGDPQILMKGPIDVAQIMREKTKFCNFVYSNGFAEKRNDFFHKLSQYKQVDSGGRHLNNIGAPVVDKLSFIKQYKFTIAFENGSHPGYTTEKLVHPMMVYSLPIYWGNERIDMDFNTRSFLNYHDFPDEEALIQRIVEVDQNDDLYREYLSQPYFHQNRVNPFINPENIIHQFHKIFDTKIYPRFEKNAVNASLSSLKVSNLWNNIIKNKNKL